MHPGRYGAIDVGTNSVLLLVADVDAAGQVRPVVEQSRITRLGENVSASGVLASTAMSRTLHTVVEYASAARHAGAEQIAVVGTAVLRDAANAGEFCHLVRVKSGLPVEVITGVQEAELAWRAQASHPVFNGARGPCAVLDIGGGSTEVVQGEGAEIKSRVSYNLGAVKVTERYLRGDPPTAEELAAAEAAIEQQLSSVEPLAAGIALIGTGGTILNLGAVARSAGMIGAPETHGAELPHTRVTELVDLFRSLPVRFRQRIPSLEPERADIILAGAMVLHQAMARLSAPSIWVSVNGIRHGCVLLLAERTAQLVGS